MDGRRRTHRLGLFARAIDASCHDGLICSGFLFAAIAIKLNSRRPVFYSQERTGLGQKLFTLYKFRSMSDNAEAESGPVCERNEA